jgi:hypothetical protein
MSYPSQGGFNSSSKRSIAPSGHLHDEFNFFLFHKGIFETSHFFYQPLALVRRNNFDFHKSVHREIIMKVTDKMQLYRLIYYS